MLRLLKKVTTAIRATSAREFANNNDRILEYARYQLIYDSILLRKNPETSREQYAKAIYNYARPVANIAATFLAGHGVAFEVSGEKADVEEADETSKVGKATQAIQEIWDRSDGDDAFFRAALSAAIKGDMVIALKEPEKGQFKIKWMDPAICFPEWDPHDNERMIGMTIAYRVELSGGGEEDHIEVWKDGKLTITKGDVTTTEFYDDSKWGGGPPFVWVPNDAVLGEVYGRSDLQILFDLVEAYDHTSKKRGGIIDYYAKPNVYMKGVPPPTNGSLPYKMNNIYYLPEEGEIGFIEWEGNQPAIKEHLEHLLQTICEVTETPRIAFGVMDSGIRDISGVALKVMYTPIMNKTVRKRKIVGPALKRIMYMALRSMGGFDNVELSDINPIWANPIPVNDMEQLQGAQIKKELGVSRAQILRELHYTPEEIALNDKERKKEDEEQAKFEEEHAPEPAVTPKTPPKNSDK